MTRRGRGPMSAAAVISKTGTRMAKRRMFNLKVSERERHLEVDSVCRGHGTLIQAVVLDFECGVIGVVHTQSRGRALVTAGEDVDGIAARYVHVLVTKVGPVPAELP